MIEVKKPKINFIIFIFPIFLLLISLLSFYIFIKTLKTNINSDNIPTTVSTTAPTLLLNSSTGSKPKIAKPTITPPYGSYHKIHAWQ